MRSIKRFGWPLPLHIGEQHLDDRLLDNFDGDLTDSGDGMAGNWIQLHQILVAWTKHDDGLAHGGQSSAHASSKCF